jgi:tRNA (cmo5U34)-methyltransferase
MDYDAAPPFPVGDYRRMQAAIPGVAGFYRLVRAALEATTAPGASVLLVGAGGGREMETLGPSPHGFRLVGVDPSAEMLERAREVVEHLNLGERAILIRGTVEDVPPDPLHDAATSLLVMHFLPDDGAKDAYLRAIRARLKPGAPLLLAGVSFEDRGAFDRLVPLFLRHAELAGLAADEAAIGPRVIGGMPIISERRAAELLAAAGFAPPLPIFRGLWYAALLAHAA